MLNLFLALLLSSFGAQSLSSNNGGGNGGDGNGNGDEAPNKLMEAIDRIRRWSAFVKSRCCPLSTSAETGADSDDVDQPPLLDATHSLPDLGQSVRLECSAFACLSSIVHTGWLPKSKPLPNDKKIVLNRIKACQ